MMFPVCAGNGKENADTHSHSLTHSSRCWPEAHHRFDKEPKPGSVNSRETQHKRQNA